MVFVRLLEFFRYLLCALEPSCFGAEGSKLACERKPEEDEVHVYGKCHRLAYSMRKSCRYDQSALNAIVRGLLEGPYYSNFRFVYAVIIQTPSSASEL